MPARLTPQPALIRCDMTATADVCLARDAGPIPGETAGALRRRRRADRRKKAPMPYYRCSSCGADCYSAAGYSTVPECPTCGTSLQSRSNVLTPRLSAANRSLDPVATEPRDGAGNGFGS